MKKLTLFLFSALTLLNCGGCQKTGTLLIHFEG